MGKAQIRSHPQDALNIFHPIIKKPTLSVGVKFWSNLTRQGSHYEKFVNQVFHRNPFARKDSKAKYGTSNCRP